MFMRRIVVAAMVMAFACIAWAAAPQAAPPNSPVNMLDTGSYWRCLFVHAPSMVRRGDRIEVLESNVQHRAVQVPSNWMMPEFDDGGWTRRAGPFAAPAFGFTFRGAGTSCLSLICLRGYFTVADPGASGGMVLSLSYRGGVVVYVNGKELVRAHLPTGQIKVDTPAEDYPLAAFFSDDANNRGISWGYGEPEKFKERLAKRVRKLEGVKIPVESLKKGLNVLAIEIHRAPLPEQWTKLNWSARNGGDWVQAGLVALSLQAPPGCAVIPDVTRPRGFQVWNADALQSVTEADYGTPGVPLRPIRLIGAINGVASGQVVASSDQPIKGLKVELGDFQGPGSIPTNAIQVRFPRVDGSRFDVLFPSALDELRVEKTARGRHGAVQPIWVTVNVPPEALPGEYEAALTVSAEDVEPVRVPVKLKVSAWRAPPPHDYATFVDMVQSPESVALQYGVPLWSDEHWELLARTCRLLGQVGSRVVYLPLISRTNMGNSESMVRWIKQADGRYTPDFSILERYLDVWEANAGRPEVVCLYVWEIFCGGGYFRDEGGKPPVGPSVTVLDPMTGHTETMTGPVQGTPEAEMFWKPVFDELRARLNKRGITDERIMVGIGQDVRPSRAVADFFLKIAPYARWVLHTHKGPNKIGAAEVGYKVHVWDLRPVPDPRVKRVYGWRNPALIVAFLREGCKFRMGLRFDSPLPMYRLVSEGMLLAGERGFGRLGADFWPVIKGPRRVLSLSGRYPESNWSQLNLTSSTSYVLAPGPDGALATIRFEMLRQGLLEAEARIVLEKALTDPAVRARLGEDFAGRCQELLDERARWFLDLNREEANLEWFGAAMWQDMADQLFTAAAEVSARQSGKPP